MASPPPSWFAGPWRFWSRTRTPACAGAALLAGAEPAGCVRVEPDAEHAVLVGGARSVRGVEVEEAVGLELRIDLDAEQSLLAVAVHREAARGHHASVGPSDLHGARLLGHHHPPVGQEAEVGQLSLVPDVGGELEGVRRPARGERLRGGLNRGQENGGEDSAHAWSRSRASRTPAGKPAPGCRIPLSHHAGGGYDPRRPWALHTGARRRSGVTTPGPSRGSARQTPARRSSGCSRPESASAHIFQSAARDQSG